MYGKSKLLGVSNVATGLAILPSADSNRVLFAIAAALLLIGGAVLALSVVLARKSQSSIETK